MSKILFSFILLYWIEIIMFLLVGAAVLVLYRNGRKDLVRKMILSFVVQAEKNLGSGTGELKYAFVVERVYEVMPRIFKLLYTKKQIDGMIEEAVEYLKRYLAEGKNLLGYGEEPKEITFDFEVNAGV